MISFACKKNKSSQSDQESSLSKLELRALQWERSEEKDLAHFSSNIFEIALLFNLPLWRVFPLLGDSHLYFIQNRQATLYAFPYPRI